MRRVVMATYDKGMLKPKEKLPLTDRQQVLLVVVSLPEDAAAQAERLSAMEAKAVAWLAQHGPEAVRPPPRRGARRERELDAGFDAALQAVRARARRVDLEQVAADVAEALAEARALPPDAVAALDAELDAALKEWLAAAS